MRRLLASLALILGLPALGAAITTQAPAINNSPLHQVGAVMNIDSATIHGQMQVDTLKFGNGTTLTTAAGLTTLGNSVNVANGLVQENSSGQIPATVAVQDASISSMTASKLRGPLPAIDGSALTNLPSSAGKVAIDTGTVNQLPTNRIAAGVLPSNVIVTSVAVNAVPDASIVAVAASKITGSLPAVQVSGFLSGSQLAGGSTSYAQLDPPGGQQSGAINVQSATIGNVAITNVIMLSAAYGSGNTVATRWENTSGFSSSNKVRLAYRANLSDASLQDVAGLDFRQTSSGGSDYGDWRALVRIPGGPTNFMAPKIRIWQDSSNQSRIDFGSENSIDAGGVTSGRPILRMIGASTADIDLTNTLGKLVAASIGTGSLPADVIVTSVAVAAVGVPQINATGTPDNTKYLRGEGAWILPPFLALSSATATYDQKTDFLSGSRIIGGTLGAADGNALTNLNASSLGSGTIPDVRLSTSPTLKGNTFNSANNLALLDSSGYLPFTNTGALVGEITKPAGSNTTTFAGHISPSTGVAAGILPSNVQVSSVGARVVDSLQLADGAVQSIDILDGAIIDTKLNKGSNFSITRSTWQTVMINPDGTFGTADPLLDYSQPMVLGPSYVLSSANAFDTTASTNPYFGCVRFTSSDSSNNNGFIIVIENFRNYTATTTNIQAVRLDNFHVLTGTASESSATQTYNIAIASMSDNVSVSSLVFGSTVTVNFSGNAGALKERFLPTPVNISSWGPIFDGSMSVAIRITRDGSDSSAIDSFFRSIGLRLATTG